MRMLYFHIAAKVLSVCVLSLCFWSGCNKHPTAPGVYIEANKKVHIFDLASTDPILYVNGEAITKRDFDALMVLRDRIWRISGNMPFDVSESEMKQYCIDAGPGLMLQLIHHALFRQYAQKIGAVPTEAKVRESAQVLLATLKRKNSSIESLAADIGGDAGELFRKIPYIDAQDAMLRQSVTTNDLDNVSEAELKEREEFVAKFDANAEAMNARARARLLEAKKRILGGADFALEAKNIADAVNPQYGEKWGRFEIQEFPADEALHQWLRKSKPGDISDPLDLDDGLAIVKIIEKGKGDAPPGVEPPDAYTLVRCTVKACEKMRYQNRTEMTRQLLLWKREDAQRVLGEMLTSRAVIEYPNGTNLFDKVAAEAVEGEKR